MENDLNRQGVISFKINSLLPTSGLRCISWFRLTPTTSGLMIKLWGRSCKKSPWINSWVRQKAAHFLFLVLNAADRRKKTQTGTRECILWAHWTRGQGPTGMRYALQTAEEKSTFKQFYQRYTLYGALHWTHRVTLFGTAIVYHKHKRKARPGVDESLSKIPKLGISIWSYLSKAHNFCTYFGKKAVYFPLR